MNIEDIPGSPCELSMAPLGALAHSLGTVTIHCCYETVICGSLFCTASLCFRSFAHDWCSEALICILSEKPFWQSGHLSLLLWSLLGPFISHSFHVILSIHLLICISLFYFLGFLDSLLTTLWVLWGQSPVLFVFHPREAGRAPRTNR